MVKPDPNEVTVWFDTKRNEWVSSNGTPVCQDHGDLLPGCRFCRK